MPHPIHDVTNVTFIAGVTNFTLDNLYDAARNNGITDRNNLHLTVPLPIYDRLDANNLVEFSRDGRKYYRNIVLEIAPNFNLNDCQFLESILRDKSGQSVVLRTREF